MLNLFFRFSISCFSIIAAFRIDFSVIVLVEVQISSCTFGKYDLGDGRRKSIVSQNLFIPPTLKSNNQMRILFNNLCRIIHYWQAGINVRELVEHSLFNNYLTRSLRDENKRRLNSHHRGASCSTDIYKSAKMTVKMMMRYTKLWSRGNSLSFSGDFNFITIQMPFSQFFAIQTTTWNSGAFSFILRIWANFSDLYISAS